MAARSRPAARRTRRAPATRQRRRSEHADACHCTESARCAAADRRRDCSLRSLARPRQPKIPRLRSGKPDFSGIWQTTSAADYDLEPHAGAQRCATGRRRRRRQSHSVSARCARAEEEKLRGARHRDPRLKCWTLGTPRGIYYPEPFQIFQRDRDLTLVFQFGHSVRTIHTNGTLHPEVTDNEFWLGDSRGTWEGDTLVVDVRDFNDETWLDRAGNFHSPSCTWSSAGSFSTRTPSNTRRRSKIRRCSAGPGPSSVILHRHREKNFQLIEDYCFTLDYDQYYPVPVKQ